jgi:hypothetical protein
MVPGLADSVLGLSSDIDSDIPQVRLGMRPDLTHQTLSAVRQRRVEERQSPQVVRDMRPDSIVRRWGYPKGFLPLLRGTFTLVFWGKEALPLHFVLNAIDATT